MKLLNRKPADAGDKNAWKAPTAAEVKERWRKGAEDMLDLRRNYQLNHSYYMGQQWLQWNDATAVVSMMEYETQEDALDRVTVNKIKPRVTSLVSRATKTPLDFEPRPEGASQEALRKMNLQRQVLAVTAHKDDWELTRTDQVLNTVLGAVSAISVEPAWEFDEQTVVDPTTGVEVYLPRRPKVQLTALTPLEFVVEPGTRRVEDARYWIRLTTLTPEQAQDYYGLEEPPKPDSETESSSVMHSSIRSRRAGASGVGMFTCLVWVYYERPTQRGPGCVVHVVGDKVVREDPWPFPFAGRLNLRIFTQSPVSSSTWKGETVVNDARQLQRSYNRAFTSINRHIGKADSAKLLIANGTTPSIKEFDGDIAVWEYESSAGPGPQWMQAPQIPRWLREHVGQLEAEMDELFSTHAVTRGQAPGDRNSGTALAILAEKDETPLGLMARDQQAGWQAIAEMTLSTMRHLMEGVDDKRAEAMTEEPGEDGVPRLQGDPPAPFEVSDVLMNDDGESATEVRWTAADLPDDPVVHVPLETVMPRSTVAMQDMMVRFAGTFPQLFANLTPAQLTKVLQIPDPTAFTAATDPQLALAIRENQMILAGHGDEVVKVQEWHDHKKHIDQHNEERATSAFEEADPRVQEFMDLHIQAHVKLAMEQIPPSPQPMPEAAPAPSEGAPTP